VFECKPLGAGPLVGALRVPGRGRGAGGVVGGRGLHSFTFRLNVSTFCCLHWLHEFPPVYYTWGHGEV
jgi:hypothetical protein